MPDTATPELPPWTTILANPDFTAAPKEAQLGVLENWHRAAKAALQSGGGTDAHFSALDKYVSDQAAAINGAGATQSQQAAREVTPQDMMDAGRAAVSKFQFDAGIQEATGRIEPPVTPEDMVNAGKAAVDKFQFDAAVQQATGNREVTPEPPNYSAATGLDAAQTQLSVEPSYALGHPKNPGTAADRAKWAAELDATGTPRPPTQEELPSLPYPATSYEPRSTVNQRLYPNMGVAVPPGTPEPHTTIDAFVGSVLDQAAGVVGLAANQNMPREVGSAEDVLARIASEAHKSAAADPSAIASVGRGVASVGALALGGPEGKAGLVVAALRGASEAYSSTMTTTGDREQANIAAVKTLPALSLYLLGGQATAGLAAKVLAKDAPAITKALVGFAGAELANVGASSVLRALEAPPGEKLEAALPTVESMTADTLFAVIHGLGEYKNASDQAKAKAALALKARGVTDKQLANAPSLAAGGETPAQVLAPPAGVDPKDAAASALLAAEAEKAKAAGNTETAQALTEQAKAAAIPKPGAEPVVLTTESEEPPPKPAAPLPPPGEMPEGFHQLKAVLENRLEGAEQAFMEAENSDDPDALAAAGDELRQAQGEWEKAFGQDHRMNVEDGVRAKLDAFTHEWTDTGLSPIGDGQASGGNVPENTPEAAQRGAQEAARAESAPTETAKRRRRFTIPFAPHGSQDIVDFIADQGGIRLPKKKGRGQEYDDMPLLPGVYRTLISRNGSIHADEMAQMLADAGLISDGHPSTMWAEIDKTVQTRLKATKENAGREADQKTLVKQHGAFEKDAIEEPPLEAKPVSAESLQVGDEVKVGTETLKVKSIDPETHDVTLEDGKKYGVQHLADGQVIYGEHIEAPKAEGDLHEDPFALESPTEEGLKAEKKAASDKEKMAAGLAKPLAGSAGDLSADLFGEGDTPLFNERRDKPAPKAAEPEPEGELPKSYQKAADLRASQGDEAAANSVGISPAEVKDFHNGTNETGVNPDGHGQDGLTLEIAKRMDASTVSSGAPGGELTADQHQYLADAVDGTARGVQFRNEAESDGAKAQALTAVEEAARKWLAKNGSLEGFSARVVARSRLLDIARGAEATRTIGSEPVPNDEAPKLDQQADTAPTPDQEAAKAEARKGVTDAVNELQGDEKRIMQASLADPSKPLSEIAKDLGIQEDKARRTFKAAAAKLRARLVNERDSLLYLQIIPGLHEFLVRDVQRVVGGALKGIVKAFQQIRDVLSPSSAGPMAENTGNIGREELGVMARKYEIVAKALDTARKAFERSNVIANLDFIHRMETGQGQATPELNALARQLRGLFADRVRQVRQVNPKALQQLIQNYFPHIWEDPAAATDWYAKTFSKRPLQGAKSFLKSRTIPTTVDGIAAGLIPVSTNPVDLTLLKLREMDRYVMAQSWVKELRAQGIMKLFRPGANVPDGWTKVNDKIAEVWQRGPNRELILRGHYYAPDEAAAILNNHLSPGLRGNVLYDAVRWGGNLMNQVQLGLSAFHLMFTAIDSATSKTALGIVQMSRGRIGEGALNVAKGVIGGVFTNPAETLYKGSRILREYYKPGSVGGEVPAIVNALVKAGGRVKMDSFFKTGAAHSFAEEWRAGNYVGALARSPFAAVEVAATPLMEFLVPRMKLGVFHDLAHEELQAMRAEGVTDPNEVRSRLSKVWDSVDNRMGQLVYDNLFWNRVLKDGLMASVRSVGWNVGDIRELAGGAADTLTAPWRVAKQGVGSAVTHRMGYIAALPLTVAYAGALYQYLRTGLLPGQKKDRSEYGGIGESLRDMFMPRTGKTLPDGSEERIMLPSYVRDIASYAKHPLTTVSHKLHPILSMLSDMVLRNKDYFGTEIRNADDPIVQQMKDEAEFAIKQFRPFTLSNSNRREGSDTSTKIESFFGLQQPPAEMVRTPAMNKLMDLATAHMPQLRSKADAESSQARAEAKKDIRRSMFGDERPTTMDEVSKIADRALAQKMLTKKDWQSFNGAIAPGGDVKTPGEAIDLLARKADARVALFKRLSLPEAQRVMRLANEEELKLWTPVLLEKERLEQKKAAKAALQAGGQ